MITLVEYITNLFMQNDKPKDIFSFARLIKFGWGFRETICFSIVVFLFIEILFLYVLLTTEITSIVIVSFTIIFHDEEPLSDEIIFHKRKLLQEKYFFLSFNLEKYSYHFGNSLSTIFFSIFKFFSLTYFFFKAIFFSVILSVFCPFSIFRKNYLNILPKFLNILPNNEQINYFKLAISFVNYLFGDVQYIKTFFSGFGVRILSNSLGFSINNELYSKEIIEKILGEINYTNLLNDFFLKKNNAFFYDLGQFRCRVTHLFEICKICTNFFMCEICKIFFNYFFLCKFSRTSFNDFCSKLNLCNEKIFSKLEKNFGRNRYNNATLSYNSKILIILTRVLFLIIFIAVCRYFLSKIILNLFPIFSILNFINSISKVILFKNINFLFIFFIPSLRKQFFSENQTILFFPNFSFNKLSNFHSQLIRFLFNTKNDLPVIFNEDTMFSDFHMNSYFNYFKNDCNDLKFLIKKSTTFSSTTKNFLLSQYTNNNFFATQNVSLTKETKDFYNKNKKTMFSIFNTFFVTNSSKNSISTSPSSILKRCVNNKENSKLSYYFCIGFLHNIFSSTYDNPFLTSNILFSSVIKLLSQKVILLSEKYKGLVSYGNSSGIDMSSENSFSLLPFEQINTPLDSFAHIPNRFSLNLVPRSSVSKKGILLVNSPGICDPLYQGKLCVDLFNLNKTKTQVISKGDRIAQIILIKNQHEESEKKILHLVEKINKNDGHGLIVSSFLSNSKDFVELNVKHKDKIFNFVNEIFINKRKSKGFGSTGK